MDSRIPLYRRRLLLQVLPRASTGELASLEGAAEATSASRIPLHRRKAPLPSPLKVGPVLLELFPRFSRHELMECNGDVEAVVENFTDLFGYWHVNLVSPGERKHTAC